MADLPAQPNLRVTSEYLLSLRYSALFRTDSIQSSPPTAFTREMSSVSAPPPRPLVPPTWTDAALQDFPIPSP